MDYGIPEELKFNRDGLIPAIVQDVTTGQVLMLAYMNKEALSLSLSTGQTWFFSRSRGELWHKGATSGHYQHIVNIFYDCDGDALLVQVRQEGVACHEGEFSCFHHPLRLKTDSEQDEPEQDKPKEDLGRVLAEVFEVIKARKKDLPENSYTARLFKEGQDKILKKIGEEATEVVLASKGGRAEEILYELADLYYHTLVLLAYHGLEPQDLAQELARRRR
ncbi:phosphoribosyl-ATP pyrophosphatase /phosphoribosyl-AMP cyclohydrolase [Thermanaeromonas toyohensis ToBE]|uniref:Histidine biosynthesis bifunctional protein HisIE n=1 Tax=Thermanaeromonas toyohensis ToBE TaxID=698762 RepID=A0A1W1W2F4_9FIRM|nr:bifunctional phosphoribosyl-AMP cyclohydrolase/phosphoribosyl-ATP diphosphatase HisIE [Thermanaeromonas toyohensis]SMB99802.1 phosphoribosyl-ATP pyrophosphatase /phosphoribosyl-AMP cyclohydrolase [Thermanaeromonas toyohensis ToBE]